jgi:hypothetical protein
MITRAYRLRKKTLVKLVYNDRTREIRVEVLVSSRSVAETETESNPNLDPVEPNRVEWMIFSRSRIESESNKAFFEDGRIESNRIQT